MTEIDVTSREGREALRAMLLPVHLPWREFDGALHYTEDGEEWAVLDIEPAEDAARAAFSYRQHAQLAAAAVNALPAHLAGVDAPWSLAAAMMWGYAIGWLSGRTAP